jgi:molecular chaperone GrpE
MSKDKKKTADDDISIEILSDYDDDELANSEGTKKPKAKDLKEGYDVAWTALQTQVDEQANQLETLQKETASLTDQLQRKQAEFDNYRKRVDRERSEFYQHGRREVLLEMLGVLDNFERAMVSTANTDQGSAFRQGVELIYKQFKDTLVKFGIQPIEAVGQFFDPHLHEAVTIEQTSEHEANTILAEFQKGYKLGSQLLRPSQVKVAAAED